jgi:hypothetical protein
MWNNTHEAVSRASAQGNSINAFQCNFILTNFKIKHTLFFDEVVLEKPLLAFPKETCRKRFRLHTATEYVFTVYPQCLRDQHFSALIAQYKNNLVMKVVCAFFLLRRIAILYEKGSVFNFDIRRVISDFEEVSPVFFHLNGFVKQYTDSLVGNPDPVVPPGPVPIEFYTEGSLSG